MDLTAVTRVCKVGRFSVTSTNWVACQSRNAMPTNIYFKQLLHAM